MPDKATASRPARARHKHLRIQASVPGFLYHDSQMSWPESSRFLYDVPHLQYGTEASAVPRPLLRQSAGWTKRDTVGHRCVLAGRPAIEPAPLTLTAANHS